LSVCGCPLIFVFLVGCGCGLDGAGKKLFKHIDFGFHFLLFTINLLFHDVLEKDWVGCQLHVHGGSGLLGCCAAEKILDLFCHSMFAGLLFVVV